MSVYDDVDEDILKNYNEFQLASILYYCMMESNCSEQSSRMTAMDSATKNAGKFRNAHGVVTFTLNDTYILTLH